MTQGPIQGLAKLKSVLNGADVNTDTKIALVTGADTDLGLEIARQLGHAGLLIFVGARDEAQGEATVQRLRDEGLNARFLFLDVARPESIAAAVRSIETECGRLDVLVNNAALTSESVTDADLATTKVLEVRDSLASLRKTLETNFFGAFAVAHALLPLLRQAKAARIVNMSSDLSSLTLANDPNWELARFHALAYSGSKTALNALTMSLTRELRDTSIKVNSVTPGFTTADRNDTRGTRTLEEGAREPVRLALLDAEGPTGGFFDESGMLPW